jgi:CBS domain-containing protein
MDQEVAMPDEYNESPHDDVDSFTAAGAFHGADAPVSTYMADAVVSLPADATLREAAVTIAEASVGCVVVGSADAVEGIISERDLVLAVAKGADLDTSTVGEIASTRLVWISPQDSIGSVAGEMMQDYVRHVLVGTDGNVVGVVSMRDVIAAFTT